MGSTQSSAQLVGPTQAFLCGRQLSFQFLQFRLQGLLYRAAVIGSGAHRLVMRRLLREVARTT
jgi:hypothetical protein